MRKVTWTDELGKRQISLLRDNDSDTLVQNGIPCGPPDLWELDWDHIVLELHNLLLDRGLLSWDDLTKAHNGFDSAIVTVIKPKLVELYRSTK